MNKKILIASVFATLMLVTIFNVSFSSTAITIKKEISEDEDTTDLVKIKAECHDEFNYPNMPSAIMLAKVTLRSTNGLIHRVKFTNIYGECYFYYIPENYELTVEAEHWRYEQVSVNWRSKTWVIILMERKEISSRTVSNPFLDNFPLLQLLLQRLGLQ